MGKVAKKYKIPEIFDDFINNQCFTDWESKGTYKVYQFVDLTNSNVFYVGCTRLSMKQRFKQHITNSIVHHKISEKFGEPCKYKMLGILKDFIDLKINISVDILFEFESKEKALEVEAMVIYLSCLNMGKSYNLSNIKNSQTVNYKKI